MEAAAERMGNHCYYSCWIYLWSILGAVFSETSMVNHGPEEYVIEETPVDFAKAQDRCQANGFLITLANEQEVSDVLNQITNTTALRAEAWFYYWIGLKKNKKDCVHPERPLKGFKWTSGDSEEYLLPRNSPIKWLEEPKGTCTGMLCALLAFHSNGTWGLVSKVCKNPHPFICKQPAAKPKATLPCPVLKSTDSGTLRVNPVDPTVMELSCPSATKMLTCSKETGRWEMDGEPIEGNTVSCPVVSCPEGSERREQSNDCVKVDHCKGLSCKHDCVYFAGLYKCACYDKDGKLYEEGSDACMDIPAPTPILPKEDDHLMVSTTRPGRRRRPSLNPLPESLPTAQGNDTNVEKMETHNNIFIPVLIAVMALVVLVVVVLAVVKCCIRRRSKRLAMKKAEKLAMKRAEANKEAGNGDSMENGSEK